MDDDRNCTYASIGKCSMVSLSIHCNVKSEFANPSSFTISFRYDERDIIRILILACDIHASAIARVDEREKVDAFARSLLSNAFVDSDECAAESPALKLDFNLP